MMKKLPLLALVPLLTFVGCQSVQDSGDSREWSEPTLVEHVGQGALRPRVAMDALGTAIAVWDQTDPVTGVPPGTDQSASDDIWTNRSELRGAWGEEPVRLDLQEQNEPGDSIWPQIGLDRQGNALVAFLQEEALDDGERLTVWAVRYQNGEWGPARCIQSREEDRFCSAIAAVETASPFPRVAVNDEGNAVVVWVQQRNDSSTGIFINRSTFGGSWGDAKPVVPTQIADMAAPGVGIDPSGNVTVVWEQLDGEVSSIWAIRFPAQGASGTPAALEFDNEGDARDPQVAVDSAGNAIAVWRQRETQDARFQIYANRYPASDGRWRDPTPIGVTEAGDAGKPQLAMSDDGSAVVVWAQSNGDLVGVWSNRFSPDLDWEGPTPIGPLDLGPARLPQVASSPSGDAVAVWVQFDGRQESIWSNRYAPDRGWATSVALEKDDARASGPHVAVDPDGNAVAIWTLQKGDLSESDVLSSRLLVTDPGSDTR
jgi:hypothetical protein